MWGGAGSIALYSNGCYALHTCVDEKREGGVLAEIVYRQGMHS